MANSTKKQAVGIDVGGTTIKAGLVCGKEIQGGVIEEETEKTFREFDLQIKRIVSVLSLDNDRVGLGLPALIDYKDQKVINCPNLNFLNGFRAGSANYSIANDADMALYGEVTHGDLFKENILYVGLGTGVGSSFFIGGRGSWETPSFAGELGHLKVRPGGDLCSCGDRGCLEAYSGGRAIVQKANRIISKDIKSAEEVFRLCREGNPIAKKLIDEAAEALGIAIADIVNTLGVEKVIMGGKLSKSFDLLEDLINKTAKENIFVLEKRNFKIAVSELIDKAAIIGAANFALMDL